MRIKVLMTDKAMDRVTMDDRERMLSAALSPGTEISVDCIKRGPDELDCHTDEAFAAPELVKMAIQAERDGFDAIVIYCFSDVGLDACRENVRIPMIAPGETTLAVAQTLCSRFVVVTGSGWNIPRTYRRMPLSRCPGCLPNWSCVSSGSVSDRGWQTPRPREPRSADRRQRQTIFPLCSSATIPLSRTSS